MNNIWLIRALVFLSAFLLFQIEFIVGKIFLPHFGGSFMVWGGCIVFFQAALLLGYLYAHCAVRYVGMLKYRAFHLLLLIFPFLFFPGRPLPLKYDLMHWPMVLEVFWKLSRTIGPAFFILATMSVICQAWVTDADFPQRKNPYALFAVSNAGSFLALITYPFFFEMYFDLDVQQNIWRCGYGVVVALYLLAWRNIHMREAKGREASPDIAVSYKMMGQWFLYGLAGVVMFLAVTNMTTLEIAPVPLLWMFPLVIYLLSYVLSFKTRPWCPKAIQRHIHFILCFGILFYFIMVRQILPTLLSLMILLVFLFLVSLFCQSRLYALRPHPRHLTVFYFIISLGGFLGGILTIWIVPLISSTYLEYFLALFITALAWRMESLGSEFSPLQLIWIAGALAVLYFAPGLLLRFHFIGLTGWLILNGAIFYFLRKGRSGLVGLLAALVLFVTVVEARWFRQEHIFSRRNYYGISRVLQVKDVRFLTQGVTIHGAQFTDSRRRHIPLTYYNPRSPAAEILIDEESSSHIGIIGLGTGALAPYLKPHQSLDYLELDPDVVKIAKGYFTYLDICPAPIRFLLGDARLLLEGMAPQQYRILVVDAFSGDSVPVHLLTVEAMDVYRRHLTDDGVVLFHLTNRYINLPQAVLRTIGQTEGSAAYKQDEDFISGKFNSDWVALTWNNQAYQTLIERHGWMPIGKERGIHPKPWTDKYSNIIPYTLNLKGIIEEVKKWNI